MTLEQLESVYVTGKVEDMRGTGRARVTLVDSLAKAIGRDFTPAPLLQMTGSTSD